jgi:proteasome accessory factor C
MCGLYPYTPDVLIEVDVADGRVWIRYADYFARPLDLTPGEGLALLTAGKAVLEVPDADPDGPLARGLEKLAAVLGIGGDQALEVALGPAPEEATAVLRQAVAAHRQVALEYYSFGRDEITRRVVDPYAVFSAGGQWYLSAYCHAVDDERLFRVDRVRGARLLDATFEQPADQPELSVYEPQAEDPRVVVELEPGARWVLEQYPIEELEELGGGRCRARLAVSGRAWLERLLLRLGREARVVAVDGPQDLAEAGGRAACRLLARYEGALPAAH